jgi:hypothetical protein
MKVALYIYTEDYGSNVNSVVNTFQAEVIADGGTFEAYDCCVETINDLGGSFGNVTTAKRIELFDDEKISLTSSIQNINDISKVFTDYSQSFTIPASETNNRIFKHWYENALDNGFDQRQRYKGYIEIDTQVFRTGQWQLESASVKNNRVEDYKLTFYGVLKSLTDKFGEDKLKDLETLNDYTINYTGAVVKDKIITTSDSDILFPLISSNRVWQYGGGGGGGAGSNNIASSSHPIVYTELFPALKVARIFDAIQSKYDISFNGNFLTQSRFKKAYLWLKNKDAFTPLSKKLLLNYENISNQNSVFEIFGDYYVINTNNLSSGNTYAGGGVTLTLSVSTNWQVSIFKDDVFYYVLNGTGTAINISAGDINGTYKIYLSTAQACTYTGAIGGTEQEYDTINNQVINFTSDALVIDGTITSDLDLPSFTPDMKVSDFFSGILKMFNLTAFSFDEENYTLEQLENWYYQGGIKDFSEYCITDFDYERIKPYKKVNFEYEKSESFLNKNYSNANQKEYGNLSYPFNNDGSDYNIKLPFENLMFNKFTDENLQVAYSLKSDFTKYIPKPVILYQYENTSCDFYFNNGTTTTNITNYNVMGQDVEYQSEIHTLNWGVEFSTYTLNAITNTLFKDYYFDYLNNLYSLKSRMVKVAMRLPYSELLALRLNDRIVIRDKRYIINSFTTDLDTFESKFELVQDFRSLTFNNSLFVALDNTSKAFRINTTSREPLTWSILNDPTGQIITITNADDYVEIDTKANTSGVAKIYSIESNNNDIIVITQEA